MVRTIDDLFIGVVPGRFVVPLQFLTRLMLLADSGSDQAKNFIMGLEHKRILTGNLIVRDPLGAGKPYLSQNLVQRLQKSPKLERLYKEGSPPEVLLTLVSKEDRGYDAVYVSSFARHQVIATDTCRSLTDVRTRTEARRFYTLLFGTPNAVYPQRPGLLWGKYHNQVLAPYAQEPIKQISFQAHVAKVVCYSVYIEGISRALPGPEKEGFSVKILSRERFVGPSPKVSRDSSKNVAI